MYRSVIYLTLFVSIFSLAGNASAGLVAHWKLDEGSGTTAADSSGNGNDARFEGDPQWVDAGKFDGAVVFNGGTDYLAAPDSDSLDIKGDQLSLAAWVNSGTWGGARHIVRKIADTGTDAIYFIRGQGTKVRADISTSADITSIVGSIDLPTNDWVHLVLTYDGAEARIYINGVFDVSVSVSGEITESNNELRIGRGEPAGYFAGMIDDVRIYNHALSEGEFRKLIFTPKASKPVPANGDVHSDTWVNLSWTAGIYAVSHDVYLGDNFDDVNDRAAYTFRGNQAATYYIAGFPGYAYPEGLVPGTTYYWLIDEVNNADPNSPWKGDIWSFIIPARKAYDPAPPDGSKFVDPNVTLSWSAGMNAKLHHVYFGENFDDVNSSTLGISQANTTYNPGKLQLEKTYYWRIDEFDGVTTYKGDVWSFTTLPDITITEPNLAAWWTLDEGMGNTILDWSGHGNHGTLFGPRWVIPGLIGNSALRPSGGYVAIQNLSYNRTGITGVTVCAWIRTISSATQYIVSFDRDNYYRLEINGNGGGPGQVGWDVMTSAGQVDYGSVTRVDDGIWHHVTGVFDNGAMTIYIDGKPESSTMGGPTFGSGNTRYGFIGANSEATAFDGNRGTGSPIFGEIDDLRIYDMALTADEIKLAMRGDSTIAWNPNPANGTAPYVRDALPLSWSPGDKASGHEVYFGTDLATVLEADASDATGVYRGRQSTASYTPPEGVEWGGGPYYWRVDENNTDGTVSKGSVWSFTVADFLKIEDFEDYNDFEPDRIFDTWLDGWGVATNGSEVGYADPNFDLGEHHVETATVHGGFQSMPYFYDTNLKYSEAFLSMASVRNWTEEGVAVLSLWFNGDPANAAEKMYVSISNANGVTGTVYHDDPNAAQIDIWTEWTIELQKFADQGVDLTNVDKIAIGFGDKANLQAGGTGLMFFDDICLRRPSELLAE